MLMEQQLPLYQQAEKELHTLETKSNGLNQNFEILKEALQK